MISLEGLLQRCKVRGRGNADPRTLAAVDCSKSLACDGQKRTGLRLADRQDRSSNKPRVHRS